MQLVGQDVLLYGWQNVRSRFVFRQNAGAPLSGFYWIAAHSSLAREMGTCLKEAALHAFDTSAVQSS